MFLSFQLFVLWWFIMYFIGYLYQYVDYHMGAESGYVRFEQPEMVQKPRAAAVLAEEGEVSCEELYCCVRSSWGYVHIFLWMRGMLLCCEGYVHIFQYIKYYHIKRCWLHCFSWAHFDDLHYGHWRKFGLLVCMDFFGFC